MTTQDRALEFAKRCELAGKPVRRIVIDGKRFEIEFADGAKPETPENVDWSRK